MKKSDIKPKIIELAREIAKLWRMEIYEGCWYHHRPGASTPGFLAIATKEIARYINRTKDTQYTPIPDINDCLEKLRELGWTNVDITLDQNLKGQTRCLLYIDKVEHRGFVTDNKNIREIDFPALHEALLSALLKVLEEEGK